MKWNKLGLVYAPDGERWWARSYATIPTADVLDNGRIRIYFASLDENRFGRIGYVEVDAENPTRVLFETPEPILDIGELGTFDDCGVNPSCIIDWKGQKYLYYIGWQRAERVPYMLFAGLAESQDGGKSFRKYSRVAILDRTNEEPFTRSATTVLADGKNLKMWYVSALHWIKIDNPMHGHKTYPKYVIKHAVSVDGKQWNVQQGISINFRNEDEFGFGRPWVIQESSKFRMWYSIRSKSVPYRIGYAESIDGLTFVRQDDKVGITVSDSGWDSEMICYPCVVDVHGERYMFYNGNRHGSTGFGCAVLEK
jgi:predicted GH43/DUF377 family glycosyl hydrolase